MKLRATLLLASTALAFLGGCQTPPTTTSTARPPASVLPPLSGEILATRDVDTAPQVRSRAGAQYPFNLRRDGVSGEAVLQFVVDTQGNARDIEIVSFTHKEFGPAATAAIAKWRFAPARKDGQPVNCRMQMPLKFNLHDSTR